MGVTVKTPPPPPLPPPAPDQSSVAIQQFGALFRRKAASASGYEGTFKAGPGGAGPTGSPSGAPVPFHTDTTPPPPPPSPLGTVVQGLVGLSSPQSPTTSQTTWRSGQGTTAGTTTRIVIDPVTGMPVEKTELVYKEPVPAPQTPTQLRRKLEELGSDSTLLGS